ncbi:hypothetical protein IGL98_003240 [Enterococcus sp. DIV0840]|uniref:PqqD family peptide maturation chaperone WgkC n=1 Tax=Enterococcus TaxID=1350 RepID=UPI001A8F414F|nr:MULTISPECIES: PqqD family protein [Enterococcus]MBO0434841.1 PqqD family protein [Enterococcus sp. DIV0849a]MBO0475264.1 PqqD family protein [Enterococcus ureasiticus]
MLVKNFYIDGKKKLYFEKDEEMNFLTFDPIRLSYFEVSNIGAEILYCISKKMKLEHIVELITEEYEISKEGCISEVIEFLNYIPIQDIIYTNLIQSDVYLYLEPFNKEVR